MASTTYDVQALLSAIDENSKNLGRDKGEARRECLAAARKLCYALETPVESILRINWAELSHHAALRIAVDLKLFEKLDSDNGSPKGSSELAEMTNSDPVLLNRLLKHLAAMGSVYEAGPDSYVSTPVSKAYIQPVYRDAIPICMDTVGPAVHNLYQYLAKTQYKTPTNPVDGPFQYGHGIQDHFFEHLQKNPERFTQFSNHMAGYRTGRASWMDEDFYPVKENLVKGASTDEDAVFLVDVGGSKGHDLEELKRKHPTLPGRLVLQDLANVLAEATELDPTIIKMEHDFFTPQPVQGARAYYMHSCLHDWPDAKAKEILASLKPGMTKGYSKLLINENVIPDMDAHWASTGLDLLMMTLFSSSERTEEHWRMLLESEGFKIAKIWTNEPGTESLIEAELA